ncbi:MAG: tRNA adenosine(34) deaminase TadA [Anaerovoracaceae bacterium]|jgi:tRNA(adenine34) deaminase
MGQAEKAIFQNEPETFMREALVQAEKAFQMGEIPIGAVVVKDGEILGRGHNRTERDKDPTAHAEIIALRQAAKALNGWRLTGCNLYVTAEPCPMCAGAIVLSRIDRLFIGTGDPKSGACGSLYNIPQDSRLNHYTHTEIGILKEECSSIIKKFFKMLRSRNKI